VTPATVVLDGKPMPLADFWVECERRRAAREKLQTDLMAAAAQLVADAQAVNGAELAKRQR
jgi:hypothetical protein